MPVLKYRDPTTGEFVPVPQSIASVDGYATEAYVDANKVDKAGDTMTGYLLVQRAESGAGLWVKNSVGNSEVYVDAVPGSVSGMRIMSDGKARWLIGDDGTRLVIARYDQSTGAWIETAAQVSGSNGEMSVTQDLTANDAVIGKIWSGTHIGIQQAPQGADGAGGPALLLGNTTNNGATYLISRVGGQIVLRPTADNGSYDSTFSTSLANIPTEMKAKHVRWDQAKNYSGGDLNALRDNGFYDGSGMGNAPSGDWYHVLHLEHSSNPSSWRRQIAWHFYNGTSYTRIMNNGSWWAWEPMGMQSNYGTVTPASGWTHYGSTYGNVSCFHNGTTVHVYGLMKTTTTVGFNANQAVTFGTLPSSGWWPAQTLITAGSFTTSLGSNQTCRLDISSTDGQLRAYATAAGSYATGNWVAVNASYPLK
jgi:hypothetical protein